MPEVSPAEWNQFVARHPSAHLLQTSLWGELKSGFGWQAVRVVRGDCGAQILLRKLPLGLSMAYVPKGPLGEQNCWNRLFQEIDQVCRRYKSILMIVEPDLWIAGGSAAGDSIPPGFEPGLQNIQPPRTIVVNLAGSETDILARMKQKTRYNIRLAQKHGVKVSKSTDLAEFHRLMLETGERNEFGIHSFEYYRRAYELFAPEDRCAILTAEYAGTKVAALMVFAFGGRAWYLYGASSDLYREHMPTYLLQWEAMIWARQQGCLEYDLWGVPDADEEILENNFLQRNDGLWGVYRFKRGFGGELRRSLGPWQRVYNQPLYLLYRWWVQRRNLDA